MPEYCQLCGRQVWNLWENLGKIAFYTSADRGRTACHGRKVRLLQQTRMQGLLHQRSMHAVQQEDQ